MSMEWFKDLEAKRNALTQQIAKEGQGKLKEAFDQIFINNPQLNGITWTQYTPFFNDGEECIFTVHEPTYITTELDEDKDPYDYEGDDENFTSWDDRAKNLVGYEEIRDLFASEDVFRLVFGDHAQIVATREGFDVREYDHE